MRSTAAVKSVIVTVVGLAPRGHQRRLVDQVGQVGAAEARGQRGHLVERDGRIELDLAHVHLQDVDAALAVGPVDQHLAVEAAGAQQRRVQDLRAGWWPPG